MHYCYTDNNFIMSFLLHFVAPPPSPPDVKELCSNVVWYSPAVTCEGMSGYEVRLYSPQSRALLG